MKRSQDKKIGLAALAEQVEADLGAIRRTLRKPLEAAVAQGELTAPQTTVMQIVVRHDGISLKDLSRAVSLAHSTASGIVDRLERRGLIERRASSTDGRISLIYPTAVVKDFVRDQIRALARKPLEAALEHAKAGERIAIGNAVRRLRQLLEKA
jgi:DNA-binding MarR family transcriptional regulator